MNTAGITLRSLSSAAQLQGLLQGSLSYLLHELATARSGMSLLVVHSFRSPASQKRCFGMPRHFSMLSAQWKRVYSCFLEVLTLLLVCEAAPAARGRLISRKPLILFTRVFLGIRRARSAHVRILHVFDCVCHAEACVQPIIDTPPVR